MALTTPQDRATLRSWNFLKDYRKNRTALVDVAKIVYACLSRHAGSPPNGPNAMESALIAALYAAKVFQGLCKSKQHANPALYFCFAEALARWVLDNDWAAIIKP
jgi:hypothetical protein